MTYAPAAAAAPSDIVMKTANLKITAIAAIALVRPAPVPEFWNALFTARPEIAGGTPTLTDRPGWSIPLHERTPQRRGVWA